MKPIRVGLIGYGYASKTFHAPLIAACPGLELAAVSSSAPDKVRADFPSVDIATSAEALFARPDIELVVIPTPNDTHYALASAALAAGKHVVVDKPFTVTLDEAERLEREAAQAGKVLSVFHNRRWDADFLTLRELLGSGELGRVVTFESHFDRFRPQVPVRWRESAASSGTGLWYDLGPHLIDQALVLFGMPQAIQLSLRQLRDGAEVDDYFHAVLHYPRLEVLLHASTLTAQPGARFAVHGTAGSYIKHGLDMQEAALKAGVKPATSGWGDDPNHGVLTCWPHGEPAQRAITTRPGDYLAYYALLAAAIRQGAPNPVSAAEAIRVMRVIEAGRASAAQGCRIALAEVD
jgi:predicted dehydrogenase